MNIEKTLIFNILPHPIRTFTASMWGYYLNWIRYGPNSNTLVQATIARDYWTKEEWNQYLNEKLAKILHIAATSVPYYRRYWDVQKRKGDRSSWDVLDNWPILDKKEVRENPHAFISEQSNNKLLHVDHTSGTTGKPTLIFGSRSSIRNWYSLHESRVRRWFGVSYNDVWGMLGGKKIIPLYQNQPPYWIWNRGLHQLYLSVYHIRSETTKSYVEALWKYKPSHLIVYPSSCASLAYHIIQQGLTPPQLKVILCNSERTTPNYRAIIKKAFNCPVIDTYGMAEMCSAASECLEGNRHYWPETGIIETYDTKEKEFLHGENNFGNYVFTGLLNKDMPLIRYMNYDMGYLPDWNTKCFCGRTLPTMNKLVGRSNDMIITKDGRELRFLETFFNNLPIIEGQLIQHSINVFEIKVVPNENYTREQVNKEIDRRLYQYLGHVSLKITEVSEIVKSENGKFKPFITLINARTSQ